MTLNDFHQLLDGPTGRGYPLNLSQRQAVDHATGALWILAGPGTGKTEVLVTRTLKLVCVDGVPPGGILLTTFTRKAAKNLEDRLASYMVSLVAADPALATVDISDLRIGTLHGLCNDILQDFRSPDYQNVRLLDDVEQQLFTYRYADITDYADRAFWNHFALAVPEWSTGAQHSPGKWKRARAAIILFNRIVEDGVDLAIMRQRGPQWHQLATFYEQYRDELKTRYRCDFAHLQDRFLGFLANGRGHIFLAGDERRPGLQHVLVDEYQDTNPIQEEIYFALAANAPHNLTVVGDDDQALYRFRGGTVECMVNFGSECQARFGGPPVVRQLDENYRSHPDIVSFFDNYVLSHPIMQQQGVRAPGKQALTPSSGITGNYPAVAWLSARTAGLIPTMMVDMIQNHLLADGVITDLSQCVLLMRSTRDSVRNARPFMAALDQAGIPYYNPRSQAFMDSREVQVLLGAIVELIDPNRLYQTEVQDQELLAALDAWTDAYSDAVQDGTLNTAPLEHYMQQSAPGLRRLCHQRPNNFLKLSLSEIVYRILALEPFSTWRIDPVRGMRLSKVTRLFESAGSMALDTLRSDPQGTGLDDGFRRTFINTFLGFLKMGKLNDDEDEDVIVPQGYLPIMTIHQSKGLEFPFVFVAQIGQAARGTGSQELELIFAPMRRVQRARAQMTAQDLADQDDIRLFFVAYSRAEYGLIMMAAQSQLNNAIGIPGRDHLAFRRSTRIIP
jgi:DNA helicase-2/ATP-dependent DNA helicase PcrA